MKWNDLYMISATAWLSIRELKFNITKSYFKIGKTRLGLSRANTFNDQYSDMKNILYHDTVEILNTLSLFDSFLYCFIISLSKQR